MRRSGAARALVIALMTVAVLGRDVSAAGVGGATWTPSVATTSLVVSGFRTFRDSVYVFVALTWDAAGIRGLRRYEDDGLRYTQEVNDLSGHLSATGYWTSDLPGASYDRDDDEGDGRWEEVEITVTEPRALRAGRVYHVGFQFSRWSRACESEACGWRWDFHPGKVWALSQLSSYFFGEWQAIRWTDPYAFERYRRMGRPDR